MHWIDVVAGWVQIAADALLDYIKDKAGGGGPGPKSMGQGLTNAVVGEGFNPRVWGAEQLFGNAGGGVRLLGRAFCDDYHGPASLTFGANQGMLGGRGLELKSTDDGIEVQRSMSGAGGLVGATETVSYPNEGPSQRTDTVRGGGFQSSRTDGGAPTRSQNWL
jgi:hypothetical protein